MQQDLGRLILWGTLYELTFKLLQQACAESDWPHGSLLGGNALNLMPELAPHVLGWLVVRSGFCPTKHAMGNRARSGASAGICPQFAGSHGSICVLLS
jgi:hypothetical protein